MKRRKKNNKNDWSGKHPLLCPGSLARWSSLSTAGYRSAPEQQSWSRQVLLLHRTASVQTWTHPCEESLACICTIHICHYLQNWGNSFSSSTCLIFFSLPQILFIIFFHVYFVTLLFCVLPSVSITGYCLKQEGLGSSLGCCDTVFFYVFPWVMPR